MLFSESDLLSLKFKGHKCIDRYKYGVSSYFLYPQTSFREGSVPSSPPFFHINTDMGSIAWTLPPIHKHISIKAFVSRRESLDGEHLEEMGWNFSLSRWSHWRLWTWVCFSLRIYFDQHSFETGAHEERLQLWLAESGLFNISALRRFPAIRVTEKRLLLQEALKHMQKDNLPKIGGGKKKKEIWIKFHKHSAIAVVLCNLTVTASKYLKVIREQLSLELEKYFFSYRSLISSKGNMLFPLSVILLLSGFAYLASTHYTGNCL